MGLGRRLLIPVVVVVGLLVPAVPAASAAGTPAVTPKAQRITGTLQTIVREDPPGRPAEAPDETANDTTKVLRVGTRIVPLADGSLATTENGTTVAATIAAGSDGTSSVLSASTVSAPADELISSTHQVYVALVLPAGITADPSLTDASARAMVSRASAYWSSQTGGKVSFSTARVLPAYRSAYGCADLYSGTYDMWEEALARMPAASGPGRHLVLVAPYSASSRGCAYGLGTIGAVEADGNAVFVSGLNQSLLSHELGHNLGLYHSNSLRCTPAQDLPMVSLAFPGCRASAYDDLFDVMGYSGTNYGEGSLNAVHLDGMSLLPGAVRKIAANSGVTTARIAPLSTTTNSRTLKITDPAGADYFVEYRTNSGRDTVAGRNPWRPSWGVRVLLADPRTPASSGSYELDATPTSLSGWDYNRSVPVGGTFTSASRKLTVRVAAQDSAGATLTITNWAGPIVPYRVTQSTPTKAFVGAAVTSATRVSDQYGRAVAGWTVNLQKLPRGRTTWQPVTSRRTSSTGTASYRFANGVSGSYRWVTSPATGTPGRDSPSMAVISRARVVQRTPARSIARREFLSISGSVSSVPAPAVYIQYRVAGGSWRMGPRATVRGTAVSARIRLSVPRKVYIRLYVRGTTSYAGSVSGTSRTRVT